MVLDVEVLGSFGQTRVSRDFNAGLRIFVQWNARGRCDFAEFGLETPQVDRLFSCFKRRNIFGFGGGCGYRALLLCLPRDKGATGLETPAGGRAAVVVLIAVVVCEASRYFSRRGKRGTPGGDAVDDAELVLRQHHTHSKAEMQRR